MLELKTRVEELKMENEYQLRLKDMNYNEKMKELTEKFIQEMESLKTKNQAREIAYAKTSQSCYVSFQFTYPFQALLGIKGVISVFFRFYKQRNKNRKCSTRISLQN